MLSWLIVYRCNTIVCSLKKQQRYYKHQTSFCWNCNIWKTQTEPYRQWRNISTWTKTWKTHKSHVLCCFNPRSKGLWDRNIKHKQNKVMVQLIKCFGRGLIVVNKWETCQTSIHKRKWLKRLHSTKTRMRMNKTAVRFGIVFVDWLEKVDSVLQSD